MFKFLAIVILLGILISVTGTAGLVGHVLLGVLSAIIFSGVIVVTIVMASKDKSVSALIPIWLILGIPICVFIGSIGGLLFYFI